MSATAAAASSTSALTPTHADAGFQRAENCRKVGTVSLDPHVFGVFASTFCVALLMTLSGIHKSLLGWKNGRRQCPSCGRQLRSGCTCR